MFGKCSPYEIKRGAGNAHRTCEDIAVPLCLACMWAGFENKIEGQGNDVIINEILEIWSEVAAVYAGNTYQDVSVDPTANEVPKRVAWIR